MSIERQPPYPLPQRTLEHNSSAQQIESLSAVNDFSHLLPQSLRNKVQAQQLEQKNALNTLQPEVRKTGRSAIDGLEPPSKRFKADQSLDNLSQASLWSMLSNNKTQQSTNSAETNEGAEMKRQKGQSDPEHEITTTGLVEMAAEHDKMTY